MTKGNDSDYVFELLLVEDSPTDVELTREALKETSTPNRMSAVSDGEEAIKFLRREAPYTDAPRPDLILLDLNLPKKDGREVLAIVKADAGLRSIPVLVLSTSRAEADIETVYDLHANCFITKPVDFDQFTRVVAAIETFWMQTATLKRTDD